MAIITAPSGFNASSGPDLLIYGPYESSDTVIWVDSASTYGTSADTSGGTMRTKPKATLFGAAGAISACTTSQSNLIICEASHRESVAAYTWAKNGITLCSLGTGTSVARFTMAGATTGITASGTEIRIENCYFPASSAAVTSKITASGAGFELRDCRFDMGANDTDATNYDGVLISGVSGAVIKGCTFTVMAADHANFTRRGVRVTGASTNFLCESCTFDGDAFGWPSGYALEIDTATADRFRLRSLTLSNYSYAGASTSGVKGYVGGKHVIDSTSGFKWAE